MNPPRKTPSSRSSHEKESAPLSIDYDHLSRLCLKYWKWLLGGVLLGIVGGLLFAATQTSIYAATATIVVPVRDPNATNETMAADVTSGEMIKTFEQLLQGSDLALGVVKGQHLNENPDFLPPGASPPVSEETAAGILAGETTVKIRLGTRLIDIKVEHQSPKMAQQLANWVAQESVTQEFEGHSAGSSGIADNLKVEVLRLQQKVAESDRALQDYLKAHGMTGVTITSTVDPADQHVQDLNQQLNVATAQVNLLQERYGPEHPRLIQAQKLVEELQTELKQAQNQAVSSSANSADFTTLKTEAQSYRVQLDNTLKELQTVQSNEHVAIPGLRVTAEADSAYLVRPNRTKAVGIGGFIGLVCGFAFILGLYFMDSSIRTVSQAEGALSLPVIAAIPILKETDGKSILPTYSDPQSFVAEAFRGLRASLILHDRENPLKTILVCSAIPGEGKSFCGSNLAVAFAQAGLKTLLIDADLRLPTLHSYFDLPANQENNGFQDVLTGRATLATAVIVSQIPTLELLLTTTPADSPAELLSSSRLPLMLDEAAQKYDRIVIDSAPLNAVSDTMLIMQKADAVLLVVRAGETPASESKSALQKISSSKMKPLGLILNYLAPHTLKSYAYGYSYGQKPKDKNAK